MFICIAGTGPVTYRSSAQKNQFVTDIQKLRAHGGGDCPELTFKGILDAMAESPNYGSPMYASQTQLQRTIQKKILKKYFSLLKKMA